MNSGSYAARMQVTHQCIPVFNPNNKKMEIVLSARWDLWDLNA